MVKELSKKRDRARKWQSFKRHTLLILQPFLIATVLAAVWYGLWSQGYHFSGEDEGILAGAIVTMLAIAYSIIAALVLTSVWEKYRKVVIAVLQRDKHTFLVYRDERMPLVLHIFIASLSLPLLIMAALLDYQSKWSGITAVFLVSFILSLYWIVVAQLENPAKGAWFTERIPQDWLDEDIDRFFELGNHKENNR